MRALRTLFVTALIVALLSGMAYGAGWVMRQPAGAAESGAQRSPAASPSAKGDRPSASPTPADEPPASPAKTVVLAPGATGTKVRALESRLHQIAWLPELTTGTYDATVRAAVRGFQAKRGLPQTGRLDQRTWRRLVAMTERPTHDQLFNVLHPGPALLSSGDSGEEVRDLQARLISIQWLFGKVSGTFDPATVEAVRGFQAKREIPETGEVDRRTLERLHAMTTTPSHATKHNLGNQPGQLDERCRTGRVLCID